MNNFEIQQDTDIEWLVSEWRHLWSCKKWTLQSVNMPEKKWQADFMQRYLVTILAIT
jgi:hypothetical protein